jgi:hypothetical protein
MNKQNAVFWLRVSYWSGAIIDGFAAIPMLFPKYARIVFGFPEFSPEPAYRYAMGMGAALMLGWTVLLLWADQDPLARKGVLLITVFPAIMGIIGTEVYAVTTGFIPLDKVIGTWALQILLIALFSGSYLNGVRYEQKNRPPQ